MCTCKDVYTSRPGWICRWREAVRSKLEAALHFLLQPWSVGLLAGIKDMWAVVHIYAWRCLKRIVHNSCKLLHYEWHFVYEFAAVTLTLEFKRRCAVHASGFRDVPISVIRLTVSLLLLGLFLPGAILVDEKVLHVQVLISCKVDGRICARMLVSCAWIRVVHGSDGPVGRVGSGRVTILPAFGGSGRVGSALRIFNFFTDYFLVPESIWIFEYCIRIDWFYTIFNIE